MCGIIGITFKGNAAPLTYVGLCSLIHRGAESTGIVCRENGAYKKMGGMGTPPMVFTDVALADLRGEVTIGHSRYSTAGSSSPENVQPIEGSFRGEQFWIGHNGNFVRTEGLRRELEGRGYSFKTTTDTEILAALIHYSEKPTFEEALKAALKKITGTYSLVILFGDKIFAVRDPTGNRPLVIGQKKDMMLVASETAVCDVLKIPFLRDVAPGEMVLLDHASGNWCTIDRVHSQTHLCIFELVYFLRPDSTWHGRRAQAVRVQTGRYLWQDSPVEADAVVAVPDSGNAVASGVAAESRLPSEDGLFRYHHGGRTFLKPFQEQRIEGINLKLSVIPELVRGQRIILVDDSMVRSNVIKEVVQRLWRAGTAEIHVRIGSPPYICGCHYGIDTSRVERELIAARCKGDVEQIRREIGATSLAFLSLDRLKQAAAIPGLGFCDACFSGNYPIPVS